jgi:predicted HTH transcriptional regulator
VGAVKFINDPIIEVAVRLNDAMKAYEKAKADLRLAMAEFRNMRGDAAAPGTTPSSAPDKDSSDILEKLRERGEPLTDKAIAESLGLKNDVVRMRLYRLKRRGLVAKLDGRRGVWQVARPEGEDAVTL